MINFIVWLLAGAVTGLLVTIIMRRRHSILWLNIIVGSIGGLIAGYLLSPEFHIDTTRFSFPSLLVALGGTIILLGIFNFFVREHTVTNKVMIRKWEHVREKIHVRWGKLTEEDIEQIDGNHDKFIKTIQVRYGCDEKQAEDELQGYLRAVV